jgi:hypothetical protein
MVLLLGTLVGGLSWRLVLFDGTGFEDATTGESVKTRWERFETTCIWAGVLTGSFYLLAIDPSVGIEGTVLGIWFTSFLLLWFVIRFSDAEDFSRTRAYLRGVLLFQFAIYRTNVIGRTYSCSHTNTRICARNGTATQTTGWTSAR